MSTVSFVSAKIGGRGGRGGTKVSVKMAYDEEKRWFKMGASEAHTYGMNGIIIIRNVERRRVREE